MKSVFLVIGITSLALAGCLGPDAQDRIQLTKFRVNPNRTFTYTADAVVEPGQSLATAQPDTERWLRDWLADNDMCPNGYQITDRVGAKTGGRTLWGATLYTADFTGRCI